MVMFTELVMEWMPSFFSERQRQQTAHVKMTMPWVSATFIPLVYTNVSSENCPYKRKGRREKCWHPQVQTRERMQAGEGGTWRVRSPQQGLEKCHLLCLLGDAALGKPVLHLVTQGR